MSFQRLAPNASDLQTGDLVWPRANHQIVFFELKNPQGAPWLQAQAAQQGQMMAMSAEKASLIERFNRDMWVGHVALIEIVNGQPWVVDATPHRSGLATPGAEGVATQRYEDFLADSAHTASHIWHGRIAGTSAELAQRVIQAAKRYLGKPYNISPFNFEQTNDFYCSKLIWHAIHEGTGITLKKQNLHAPQPWFTPWDVMQADGIKLLYEPAGKSYRG
jgi:Permuted papain-like amidase enzyme, YaeF/YiiX, C92 family